MVNPAMVISLINVATTMLNATDHAAESPHSPTLSNDDNYRNEDTGVIGNLLISRLGNYTHLPGCDDQMDYCEFVMDPPSQSIHILRNSDLARCDPLVFMHNYEYLGVQVNNIIVHDRK